MSLLNESKNNKLFLLCNHLQTFSFFVYIGFQLSAEKFFIFWLVITLTNMAAVSVAFCFSAATRVAAIANLLIAVAFVVSMVSIHVPCVL